MTPQAYSKTSSYDAAGMVRIIEWGRGIDTRIFEAGYFKTRSSAMDRFMRIVTRSGDGPFYALATLGLFAFTGLEALVFVKVALAAFLLERPAYYLLKKSFRRARPFEKLTYIDKEYIPQDTYSFPSGHASASMLMAVLLTWYYPPIGLLAFPWATCISFSRLYLGVHFPLDLGAGALLGTTNAIFALNLLN